ncbi:unnamed protein product [Miscanthus lutarioriparius]|uniref:Transcription factor HY5 n=1 Tax=Miscanthus lutarioriparius TaxID=422564 RepID=A0A811PZ44_9POAL|nr:unnamed protein product [Miscanthus lutarioriparius]
MLSALGPHVRTILTPNSVLLVLCLDHLPAASAKDDEEPRCKPMLREILITSCLLRNRVSAQQARERKKAYLTDLEVKVKDLEKKNSEMEERLSTLQNENQMLRQILKNTTVSRRGSGSTANGEGQ